MVLTEHPPTLSAQTKTAEMKVWQRERESQRMGDPMAQMVDRQELRGGQTLFRFFIKNCNH